VKYGRVAEVGLQGDADAIRLTIKDRGPGIPAGAREQVFQPFLRLEPSRSRATGGTGLGLAVARTIVHRHGGAHSILTRTMPSSSATAIGLRNGAPKVADWISNTSPCAALMPAL
jgi:signal transduction histidine kinase